MDGDKLVPKKIAQSSIEPEVKRALASIYQYETDRGRRAAGPYKDHYRAVIKKGSGETRDSNAN